MCVCVWVYGGLRERQTHRQMLKTLPRDSFCPDCFLVLLWNYDPGTSFYCHPRNSLWLSSDLDSLFPGSHAFVFWGGGNTLTGSFVKIKKWNNDREWGWQPLICIFLSGTALIWYKILILGYLFILGDFFSPLTSAGSPVFCIPYLPLSLLPFSEVNCPLVSTEKKVQRR